LRSTSKQRSQSKFLISSKALGSTMPTLSTSTSTSARNWTRAVQPPAAERSTAIPVTSAPVTCALMRAMDVSVLLQRAARSPTANQWPVV
jgi:hypothetical protein